MRYDVFTEFLNSFNSVAWRIFTFQQLTNFFFPTCVLCKLLYCRSWNRAEEFFQRQTEGFHSDARYEKQMVKVIKQFFKYYNIIFKTALLIPYLRKYIGQGNILYNSISYSKVVPNNGGNLH